MTLARTYALIVGWLMTIVGIVGFFSGGMLLVFEVNTVHNIIHLLTGLVALFFGYYVAGTYSRSFDQWLGIVYAVVAVLGFAVAGLGSATILGILPVNLADNILHSAIALSALSAGFLTIREELSTHEPRMPKAA